MIESGKESSSSAAGSDAQTISAARKHLVFIGGTSEPGGLHIHTADIAQSCAALGCRVTILCTSVNYFADLIAGAPVAIEVVRPLEKMAWRDWFRTWQRLSAHDGRPDIVFLCGKQGEIRIIDLAAAWLFGDTVHAVVHRPNPGAWTFRRALYGGLSSIFLKRIIVVSDEIAANLTHDFGVSRHKLSICLNWVNPQFGVPTTAERIEARQILGIAPATIVVAYIGRLAPEKRVEALLEAFASAAKYCNTPVSLVLVGDGWKKKFLTEMAHTFGIEGRTCFLGWSAAPRSALAACDIFVLPSVVEGFPLALMEALAMGCACLAHPMSSARRLIESGTHGKLADLSDAKTFAAALRELIECDPTVRSKMGMAAAKRMAAEYSRAERLPKVLFELGLPTETVPAFRLGNLEFKAGAE
jgi:glycosyltransferase involved in cell wall biosynthesis